MGGTGTYPFLVGIAWWDAGGLQIEQFFMRELSEEHALLVTLAERMAARPVLVTFNGKSFDWPLLETRYRMTRSIKPSAPHAHLDFLHPARNLWRIRLGSVRLAELEKHVLGWHRGADLISEMIPQFYFDYLRGGAPEPLVQVFLHNQMDLRGLAGLASRIIALLADPESHRSHRRPRTLRRLPHLRTPRRNRPRQKALRAVARRRIAGRNQSRRPPLSRPPREARRRSPLSLPALGKHLQEIPAKASKPTSN